VEDDVDIWHYAILELHARNDDERCSQHSLTFCFNFSMLNIQYGLGHIPMICLGKPLNIVKEGFLQTSWR